MLAAASAGDAELMAFLRQLHTDGEDVVEAKLVLRVRAMWARAPARCVTA